MIKVTSIGNYNWSSENFNTWDATTKPHIYITLNNGYYNSLETTWQNLIADATWQVGGVSYEDVNNNPVKITYNYEVGINQIGYKEVMKIGLIYISEYGFASSPETWTTNMGSLNDITNNWMHIGLNEWTISKYLDDLGHAWYIGANGFLIPDGTVATEYYAVRPTFYLTPNVTYIPGDGSQQNPFRIA